MPKPNGVGLVLQPTLDEMTEEELELRIEQVRARRIVAAMTYIEGQQQKHDAEMDKLSRKLSGQYEMLGKELDRLDRAIIACEARVRNITQLKQEAELMEDYP